MSAIDPIPINPPPGMVVTESDRVAEGRWILPSDKIRFVHGRPQKIGGNTRLTSTAMNGTPRATLCWQDYLQNGYVACGTYTNLYAFDSSYALNDITPFRATGSLGTNPFTTTLGSTSVEVTQAMPPCAYRVFDSSAERFVTMMTSPWAAASRANESPAMPLPRRLHFH